MIDTNGLSGKPRSNGEYDAGLLAAPWTSNARQPRTFRTNILPRAAPLANVGPAHFRLMRRILDPLGAARRGVRLSRGPGGAAVHTSLGYDDVSSSLGPDTLWTDDLRARSDNKGDARGYSARRALCAGIICSGVR